MSGMRVGHGYDLHRFVAGKKLMLGGLHIEHSHGLQGHSDGDAVLHALADAVLGAAALPDIGQHFPDTDAAAENMDSARILRHAIELAARQGYRLVNADITIVASQPAIAPHREAMRGRLAELAQSEPAAINIKATTEEGLGATGDGKALAVHAVALLQQDP